MALKLGVNLDSIMKLPLSRRIIILVVINAVIAGLAYWLFIGPKYDEVTRYKADLVQLNAKLAESRTIAADIPRFRKEKEDLEAKLARAVAQLPNEKEIPDLIDAISNAGEEAGLKILLFKPGRDVPKGFYAEVPVNMSVEGSYESLYDFSVKVASLPRIVNIGGMNITSAGHKGISPVLKASFVATTFRFMPGQGQGANNKK